MLHSMFDIIPKC